MYKLVNKEIRSFVIANQFNTVNQYKYFVSWKKHETRSEISTQYSTLPWRMGRRTLTREQLTE